MRVFNFPQFIRNKYCETRLTAFRPYPEKSINLGTISICSIFGCQQKVQVERLCRALRNLPSLKKKTFMHNYWFVSSRPAWICLKAKRRAGNPYPKCLLVALITTTIVHIFIYLIVIYLLHLSLFINFITKGFIMNLTK